MAKSTKKTAPAEPAQTIAPKLPKMSKAKQAQRAEIGKKYSNPILRNKALRLFDASQKK